MQVSHILIIPKPDKGISLGREAHRTSKIQLQLQASSFFSWVINTNNNKRKAKTTALSQSVATLSPKT